MLWLIFVVAVIIVLIIALIFLYVRPKQIKEAGIKAAIANRRVPADFFIKGTGKDFITGRANPTGAVDGRGVIIKDISTLAECQKATLDEAIKRKEGERGQKVIGYAMGPGAMKGKCVGILQASGETYIPNVGPDYVYGIIGIDSGVRDWKGYNFVSDKTISPTQPAIYSTGVTKIYGKKANSQACKETCLFDLDCNSYTYFDTDEGEYGRSCYGLSESDPSYIGGQPIHKSGKIIRRI